MKRFSPREMTLLCLPVVFIAGIGLYSFPVNENNQLAHSTFQQQEPDVLDAFKGADVTFALKAVGRNYKHFWVTRNDQSLELHTAHRILKIDAGNSEKLFGEQIWKSNSNNDTFSINSSAIPQGELWFVSSPSKTPARNEPPTLTGRWKIDRTKIKPFPFDKMARLPLVSLESVTVLMYWEGKGSVRSVTGEAVFRLEGQGMGANTDFQTRFVGHKSSVSFTPTSYSGSAGNTGTQGTPTTRVIRWDSTALKNSSIADLSGRVSADNRWPLDFEVEPFDIKTARKGQKLKFKAFPAPVPDSAK